MQRTAPAALAREAPASLSLRRVTAIRPVAAAQVVLILLALVVAAAAAAALHNLATAPRLGAVITGSGQVLWADPAGAAYRAGLRTGAIVTAINGSAVNPARLAAFAAPDHAGLVTMSVGGPGSFRLYVIQPAAVSPVELAGDAAALAAALALWLSGLLAGLRGRRLAAAHLYAPAAQCLALALCGLVALDGGAFWPRFTVVPAAVVGLAALLLSQLALAGRLARPLGGAIAVVGLLAAGAAALNAFIGRPGVVIALVTAVTALLALAALLAPLTMHAMTRSEPCRRSLRVAIVATAAGLLPLLVWLGLAIVASFRGARYTPPLPPSTSALWYSSGLALLALLYALLYLGADVRRLDRRTRAGLSYAVALALLGAALAAALPRVAGAGAVGVVAACVLLLPIIQRGCERLIDRAVWRPAPEYGHALHRVEELAGAATTVEDLAAAVVRELPPLLAVRGAALLVRGLDCPPSAYRLVGGTPHHDTVLELDAALEAQGPQAARPLAWHALPAEPPAAVARGIAAALWAPLWWDGAMRGALVLAARVDDDPFEVHDHQQIAALAGLLALSFAARQLVGTLHERTEALVNLTHRLSHAHEQERAHLSRELHDVVAQELIALTRQLRRYGDAAAPPPAAIWADMLTAAQDALAATRRICNGLRPAILDLGLTPALRDLVAAASERDGPPEVSLTVEGPERRFSAELEFALFRVVQEGLNNAVAHAGARQVRIEACFDGGVCVRVRDDGHGFVVPARFEDLPGDHLGLIGMRERLAEFGGALTVTSQPGRGTVLEAGVRAAD